jgi:demethoxyubiquinone hydroxylase (CLK1/Coq7/Cat5 family)
VTVTARDDAPAPAGDAGALTVYFDGACPVCSREIAAYRRQPGADACTWVDAAACDPRALGPALDRDAALAVMTVRRGDGTLLRGAAAFAAIWQALPRTRALGRIAAWPPVAAVLEVGYRGFLRLRQLWRPASAAWPAGLDGELRSDHAGETGAVWIYRGALAVARDAALRDFAARHLEAESSHLRTIEAIVPPSRRSRLLPAWRVAGWLTGALPAIAGPRAVYATVAAVERFVDGHYAQQIETIDALLAGDGTAPAEAARLRSLRATLAACRDDEIEHRDEAIAAGAAGGPVARAWAALVGAGSAAAVALARRA